MQNFSGIRFLTHVQIDKKRWDETVRASTNSLIYAHSFYLNHMCPGWSAILAPDYSWVLPLTRRKKWGIAYLYQPAFTQQLGVFAKESGAVHYTEILSWLQEHFRFLEVSWNYASPAKTLQNTFETKNATNLLLDLSAGYNDISAGYKKDLVNNLKRSRQFNHTYIETSDYKACIKLYRESYGARLPHVTDSDFFNFTTLAEAAQQHGMLQCRLVKDADDKVLATALFFIDSSRIYNIMNATTIAGRQTEANYFLLDSVIQEFAARPLIFDFEGSDVAGIKRFYENFGAINQPYFMIRYNHLPWPLRLFKR